MTIKNTFCWAGLALALPLAVHQLTPNQEENRTHMKTAALSLLMYSQDYDDILPYAQSTGGVISVVKPYVRDVKYWWPVDGGRFLFNQSLAGVSVKTVEDPARTVMIYGDTPEADAKRDVGYNDGHVKRVGADDWKDAEQTLHLKLVKAGKPLPVSLGQEYNTVKVPTVGGAPPPR